MQQEDTENSEMALDMVKLQARANFLLALNYHREAKISQLEDELRSRNDQIRHLEGQLAAMWRSTSWRLTSPLRTLARAMKGST